MLILLLCCLFCSQEPLQLEIIRNHHSEPSKTVENGAQSFQSDSGLSPVTPL